MKVAILFLVLVSAAVANASPVPPEAILVADGSAAKVAGGTPASSERRRSTERFHIAVLTASRKEGSTPELPPSEAKALADFRKVMTYRSFDVEAETLLQTDRGAEARLGTYTVLLSLDWSRPPGETIDVRTFQLRAATPQIIPATGAQNTPTYIETSFEIRRGETLVLGTSTTDQQARVVLVTLLP
jgi:hypothetical protein